MYKPFYTFIKTFLSNGRLVESRYRIFENPHGRIDGWETIIRNGDKVVDNFPVCQSANAVVDLHMKIINNKQEG